MSMERRSCTGSAPHVTKRLCATLMFFIGIVCIFGGYLLGRMARHEMKRSNDIFINLTLAAESLYKKAKLISPKAVHHHGPEKITAKLLDAFHCNVPDCGVIAQNDLDDFLKNLINLEVTKLTRSMHNSSVYLDSLR